MTPEISDYFHPYQHGFKSLNITAFLVNLTLILVCIISAIMVTKSDYI